MKIRHMFETKPPVLLNKNKQQLENILITIQTGVRQACVQCIWSNSDYSSRSSCGTYPVSACLSHTHWLVAHLKATYVPA